MKNPVYRFFGPRPGILHAVAILFLCLTFPYGCAPEPAEKAPSEELPEEGELPVFTVSDDILEVSGDGDLVQFRLTSEGPWEARSDSEWVIVSPESGSSASDRKVDVIVAANPTGQERRAAVTVTSGDHGKTVSVVQHPVETITELQVSMSFLSFPASGGSETFVVKSPAPFTLDCDSGWLKASGLSARVPDEIYPAGQEVKVAVVPQANFDGNARSAAVTVIPEGMDPVTVAVKQSGESFVEGTPGLPAVWLLNDANAAAMRATFMGPAYVQASGGSAATLSVHREKANQDKDFLDYNVASDGALEMRMLGEGDYILYDVPVRGLDAGTHVHIAASYHSDNSANSLFVFEYFDAGQWHLSDGLKTAPSGVRYHYMSNGLGLSQAYTPNIDRTVCLTEAISDGSLRMRLRCVGDLDYNGNPLDFSSNALTRVAAAKTHGTSPVIRLLDGPRPERSLKVLFIGNSYTYYNWSPYMLKEIAWKEGLDIEVALSAHSGFTIERHLSHAVTEAFVAEGGYDCAIVQEYNDRTAVVGASPSSEDALAYVDDMRSLVRAIESASPGCRTLLEMSWGTKTGSGSLIKTDWGGYAQMQEYVTAGTELMCEASGAGMTLLGKAWEKVRAERPDIEMYHTDNHHPSYAGSYLKACVNYLTLSGRPFGPAPADCLLDSGTAAYLRSVAESIVL